MRNRPGFTLIELVTVIAIIGILASLAVPKFIDVSTETKIAATKGGLAAIRARLAILYAASATGGSPASYPNTNLGITNWGDMTPPKNKITNASGNAVEAVAAVPPGMQTSPTFGFWFVAASGSPDYGKAGAYSDGVIDTSGW